VLPSFWYNKKAHRRHTEAQAAATRVRKEAEQQQKTSGLSPCQRASPLPSQ